MKTIITIILSTIVLLASAQKPLKIKAKNYNADGLVIDKSGKIYSGNAIENLKKEGLLEGEIKDGKFVGKWKLLKGKELLGYHYYKNDGNLTYATKPNNALDWVEVISDKGTKVTEIKVDKDNNIEKLYIIDYKADGSNKNTFEYEKFEDNYYDVTIADYDYNSLTVIDFFENNKGEQEIIIRDFDKHHELVKLTSKEQHVKEIFFLGDILETPEDADYKLEKGFNASFTELIDKDNFKLSLLIDNNPIFEIFVKNGHVVKLDKVLNKESMMLIYTEKEGYVPSEHIKANKIISETLSELK